MIPIPTTTQCIVFAYGFGLLKGVFSNKNNYSYFTEVLQTPGRPALNGSMNLEMIHHNFVRQWDMTCRIKDREILYKAFEFKTLLETLTSAHLVYFIIMSLIVYYYFEVPGSSWKYSKKVNKIEFDPLMDRDGDRIIKNWRWWPSILLTPKKVKRISEEFGVPVEIVLNTITYRREGVKKFFRTCTVYALNFVIFKHVLFWAYPPFSAAFDFFFLILVKFLPFIAYWLKGQSCFVLILNVCYVIAIGVGVILVRKSILLVIDHGVFSLLKDGED